MSQYPNVEALKPGEKVEFKQFPATLFGGVELIYRTVDGRIEVRTRYGLTGYGTCAWNNLTVEEHARIEAALADRTNRYHYRSYAEQRRDVGCHQP